VKSQIKGRTENRTRIAFPPPRRRARARAAPLKLSVACPRAPHYSRISAGFIAHARAALK